MTRHLQNSLAAIAAVVIFATSFTAIVSVPTEPAFATEVSSSPILA